MYGIELLLAYITLPYTLRYGHPVANMSYLSTATR